MFKYWPLIRNNTFFKLGVAAGVSYIMYELAAFFLPLLLAIALAFALHPLVNIITKIRMAHGLIQPSKVAAIILALLAFIGFISITITLLVFPLFGEINSLLQQLPALTARSAVTDLESILADPAKLSMFPSDLSMLADNIMAWAMSFVASSLRDLLRSSIDIIKNLFGLIVVPFLTFYFLKDWRQLRSMAINLFNYQDQCKAAHVIDEIGLTLSAYVNGLAKLSLLAGFVISVGTAILQVEYPLVLGFWAILAETIPVVGPLMGGVPAVFLAYETSAQTAVMVGVFYVVYYQLDANVIMPRVMGEKIDLHPVILILSLLIGAKLFGILGMVFAVPVAAVYRVLYKELWHAGEREQEGARSN